MNAVVNIEDFKKRQRKRYLKTHNAQIERFISRFISKHAQSSIDDFVNQYQYVQRNNHQDSWDYLELRDLILESLEKTLGSVLASELEKQSWYDERWLSWERLLEHCLTAFVEQNTQQEMLEK